MSHTPSDQLAPTVASEKTTVASASDQRRPTASPSQPPAQEPIPNPTKAALIAQPKLVRSVPKSSITRGATMPSTWASMPSQTSTSMHTANVTNEKDLSGARASASLNDVATPSPLVVLFEKDAMRVARKEAKCTHVSASGQRVACPRVPLSDRRFSYRDAPKTKFQWSQ